MKNFKIGVSLILVFSLFLLPLVFAEDAKGNAISATSNALKCKTNFFINVLNSMALNISVADNLTQHVNKLQEDLKQIETLATSGDIVALREFVKTNYELDLKAAREAVNTWRNNNHKNLTKEQKTELKKSYGDAEKNFNDCQLPAFKEMANRRIEEFNKHLAHYQNVTNKISARGVNVSAMQKVIDEAKLIVIAPLQAEIANATTEKEVKEILKKYCLYDGCRNGVNYHLAVRFEIAKLDATSKFLKKDGNASSYEDRIAKMENSGKAAEAFMKGIGNKAFNDGGKAVKTNVESAYNSLKETKELYKAEKERYKEMKKENKDEKKELKDEDKTNKPKQNEGPKK